MFKKYTIQRQVITDDDAKLLRELVQMPYWSALCKVHDNSLAEITDQIVQGKDSKQSLDVMTAFRGKIEAFSKERPMTDLPSLM